MIEPVFFEAVFYDGQSSKPIPAQVCIKETLEITIHPDTSRVQTLSWNFADIREASIVGGERTQLTWGTFPYQMLEVFGRDFGFLLRDNKAFSRNTHTTFQRAGIIGVIAGVLILIALVAGVYFWGIPHLMDFTAQHFPRHLEVEIGKKMDASFLAGSEIDSVATADINRFYKHLKPGTDYEIELVVVRSYVKNAMALPGGKIIVLSDIIRDMKSPAELVALMGHEIGHVEKRHTLKMLFRSAGNYIIISAILQDVNGIMAVIIDNAAKINQLSYSRQAETESDAYGFRLLRNNQADPKGMVSLFENLKAENDISNKIPQFLLTHPNLDTRISEVKMQMQKSRWEIVQNDSLDLYFKKLKKDVDKDW